MFNPELNKCGNFHSLEVVGRGNERNRVLGHLCTHIGQTGPGELPEDDVGRGI